MKIHSANPTMPRLRMFPHDNQNAPPSRARTQLRTALAALVVLLGTAAVVATPITREQAFRAGTAELPRFFAGAWRPAAELTLHDLAGTTAAYVFMFSNLPTPAAGAGADETPSAFVARQRAKRALDGKTSSSNAPELYGEDRFASIVISADDTEPVVLRCFKGLPPQVVKEAEALALGDKAGGGAVRVRHCLMLGMFDEAFIVEPASGPGPALVVDLRTRSVATEREAQARAQSKRAAADPERARQCQAAWARYQAGGTSAAAPASPPASAAGVRPKSAKITGDDTNQPLLPGPHER